MGAFTDFDDFLDLPPHDRLLVEALLRRAPGDARCFARWLAEVDPAKVEGPALRVLPALHEKFRPGEAPGCAGEALARACAPVVARARHVAEDGREALRALADAGLSPVVFKGLAMALRYYPPGRTRAMGDVDVLLRREEIARAEAALRPLGWVYAYPDGKKARDTHAHDLRNARASGFDLHWHLLAESAQAGIDDGVRARAEPFDWDGLRLHLAAPEDQLLVALVHGVRCRVPLRIYWILDVAHIVAGAGRAIDWGLLWDEARRRGVRAALFDALCMVRGLSEEVVPAAVLHALVEGDPGFESELAAAAKAEGRTWALREPVARDCEAPGSPRHVRCVPAADASLARLHLHSRHLARLGDLFDVADPPGVAAIAARGPSAGFGWLDARPGEIAHRSRPRLPAYAARIAVAGPDVLALSPGEVRRVGLEVENTSPCCWPVAAGTPSPFGVTYHLLAEDGAERVRELPRAHLALARRGYVAFVEPGQKLAVGLEVHAPEEPGRYWAQLDLVHEHCAWFSAEGCLFPRIALEVRAPARAAIPNDRV